MIKILGKSQIYEIIDFMKVLYPNSKNINQNDLTIEAYRMVLGEYAKEDIKKAITSLYAKSKYVPTLQEIKDELDSQFKIETKSTKSGVYIIFVRYQDELIQFKYSSKEDANNLISWLKTMPERKDVRLVSEEVMNTQTNYRSSVFISPEVLKSADIKRRNTWMDMKIDEYRKQKERI